MTNVIGWILLIPRFAILCVFGSIAFVAFAIIWLCAAILVALSSASEIIWR